MRQLTTTIFVLSVFAPWPLGLFGQSPLSREEAVAKALEQNLGIQMARLEVERAEVGNTWGAAGALPQLGVNATLAGAVSDQSENPTSFIQERLESQSVNVGAQLNWVLFDGFGMFANKRALETLVEQADGQAQLMIEQTIAAVLQAYDAVCVQQVLLKTAQAAVEAAEQRVKWVTEREQFGAASEFDRLQLENAMLVALLNRAQQQLAVDVAFRALNRLMGENLQLKWTLDSLTEPYQRDFLQLESEVLSNGTTLANARLVETMAKISLDQAQARLSPTLQFSASQGDQRSQFAAGDLSGDGRVQNLAANVVLNFNLFNGGATRRAIEQAKLQMMMAEQAHLDLEQEVLRIFHDVQNRWLVAADAHSLARKLCSNAAQTLNIAEERFRVGALSSLDLREVEVEWIRASEREAQALQTWLTTDVELSRLSGEWWTVTEMRE